MSETLVLPKKKVAPIHQNPRTLLIYSKPKSGKTSLLAGLEDNLILDLENGSDYVEALKVPIHSIEDLKKIGEQIKKEGKPYKYITVDTVTALEELAKGLALINYRQSAMGKNFTGKNVLELANGAGYLWLRNAFFSLIDYVKTLSDFTILSGHIKDKVINDSGNVVDAANVDLSGKIKSMICAQADTIGYLYRKGNKTIINFKSNDEVICGSRSPHLRNQEIEVAEMGEDGILTTNWDKIYK